MDKLPTEAEGILPWGDLARDGVYYQTAAATACHDAVAAVAAVEVKARDRRGAEVGTVVGSVGVLTGLQEPVGGLARPYISPEGADTGYRIFACRVEQAESEIAAYRYFL